MPNQNPLLFAHTLSEWSERNPRPLPWKETEDPYKIWLSEIILQQTQVAQGIPYYLKFVRKYPSVDALANASIDEILKDWQGLGYNSRARNLHLAAKSVAEERQGYFPDSYDTLLELKGVGEYTAAAIASFAYGESVPVIDTNVIRVVCRYLGITELPSANAVRSTIKSFLGKAITGQDPGAFNQTIMNFGALQCKPKSPDCQSCPLADHCLAFRADSVDKIPFKKPRKARRERFFHYLVIYDDDGVLVKHRQGKDIWQHMYDFPMVETQSADPVFFADHPPFQKLNIHNGQPRLVYTDSQSLTHQRIHGFFYHLSHDLKTPTVLPDALQYVQFPHLHTLPVPKIVDCYLKANSILL